MLAWFHVSISTFYAAIQNTAGVIQQSVLWTLFYCYCNVSCNSL